MAAGPAIEMWSVQDSDAESPDGRQRIQRARRGYSVTLDASDDLEIAYQAAGLPLVGTRLSNVPFVILRKLRAQRVSPILAIVFAEYSGEIGPSVPGQPSSPVDNPIRVTWGASITDEPIDEDIHGHPIVTVNNEPIDGLTERVPDLTLQIQKNFLSINTYAIVDYLRSVNSDEFFGWPAGTVRLTGYSASQIYGSSQEVGYWSVTADFQLRRPFNTVPERAWWKRVLHEGFQIRETAGGDIKHGKDADGVFLSRPVLLKEDGTVETDSESALFIEFETVFPLPYNALGLT